MVYWSLLRGDATNSPDDKQFTISSSGALSLNASPDYEDEGLGPDSKQYTVIVVASDDAPGIGVTLTRRPHQDLREDRSPSQVTNMEETGTITLAPAYPHVNVAVRATLTDGDGTAGVKSGPLSGITWKWYDGQQWRSRQRGWFRLIHPGRKTMLGRRCG